MALSSLLPEHYGYVVAAGAFTGISLLITSSLAGAKRGELGVAYPNLYASDVTAAKDPKAHKFNCAQRGALNPHESYATTLFGIAFGGLSFPLVAAGMGFGWGLGALLYYFGYASGEPNKRYSKGGILLRLSGAGLQVLTFVTAYYLVKKQI